MKHLLAYIIFSSFLFITSCSIHHTTNVESIDTIESYKSEKFQLLLDSAISNKEQKTIFVFDIDNTVLKSEQFFGGDQWYEWINSIKQSSIEEEKYGPVPDCVFDIQALSFLLGKMSLTENDLLNVFNTLRKNNIDFIGLTARSPKLRYATQRELKSNNVSFYFPNPKNVEFSAAPYPCKKESRGCGANGLVKKLRPTSFENGIFMVTGQNKGYLLQQLLQQLKPRTQYNTIVFVDDKSENIKKFSSAYANNTEDVYSLYYTHVQEHLNENLSEKNKTKAYKTLNELIKLVQYNKNNCKI